MVRVGYALMGACLLAGGASAAGENAPPLGGPFYSTGNGSIGTADEIVAFAAKGTRQRNGRFATMTTIVYRVSPLRVGPYAVGRFDAVTEYDCATNGWRARWIVARDMNNRLVQSLPPETTGFAHITPNDRKTAMEIAMACLGQSPPQSQPMVLTITDVERLMNRYRASRGG